MEFGNNPTVVRRATAAVTALTLMAALNSRHNPDASPKPPQQIAIDCSQAPGAELSYVVGAGRDIEVGIGNARPGEKKWREHVKIVASRAGNVSLTADGFGVSPFTYDLSVFAVQSWSFTSPAGSELRVGLPPTGPGEPITGPAVEVTFKCGPAGQ